MKIDPSKRTLAALAGATILLTMSCRLKTKQKGDAPSSGSKSIAAVLSDASESQNQNPLTCGLKLGDSGADETPEQALERNEKALPTFVSSTFRKGADYKVDLVDDAQGQCRTIILKQVKNAGITVDETTIRATGCVSSEDSRIVLPRDGRRIHQLFLPLLWELYSEQYIEVLGFVARSDSKGDQKAEEFIKYAKGASPILAELESAVGAKSEEDLKAMGLSDRVEMLQKRLTPEGDQGNRKYLNRFYTSEVFHSYYCSPDSRTQLVNSAFQQAYGAMKAKEELLGTPWYFGK